MKLLQRLPITITRPIRIRIAHKNFMRDARSVFSSVRRFWRSRGSPMASMATRGTLTTLLSDLHRASLSTSRPPAFLAQNSSYCRDGSSKPQSSSVPSTPSSFRQPRTSCSITFNSHLSEPLHTICWSDLHCNHQLHTTHLQKRRSHHFKSLQAAYSSTAPNLQAQISAFYFKHLTKSRQPSLQQSAQTQELLK